jgi:hypothetical protein
MSTRAACARHAAILMVEEVAVTHRPLVYGLVDRMSRERRMITERRRLEAGGVSDEGLNCITCRPLFPAHRDATAPTVVDDVTRR